MTVHKSIHPALQDEHVIAIDPPMKPDQPGVWRRRINAFTGRALSDTALTAEQSMRSGLQRLHGLSMTAGIVCGLDVVPQLGAIGAAASSAMLQISSGLGLAASGEDVQLGNAHQIAIGNLPLILPISMADALVQPPALDSEAPETDATPVVRLRPVGGLSDMPSPTDFGMVSIESVMKQRNGVPIKDLLLPLAPRRMDMKLANIITALKSADIQLVNSVPHVGVLIAQPICATVLGRQGSDCPPDPRDDPYCDLQTLDGVRLALYLWPSEMVSRAGVGPDYSMPADGPTRRNQLSYRIFDVERSFIGDECHPWEKWGVPLALLGFTSDWMLNFVDRAAVVRRGGAPKYRTAAVQQSGNSGLWQARIDQMVEQICELPDLTDTALRQCLERAPPAGVLPASCFDAASRSQHFFPSGFAVNAIPIPLSNLDLAISEAASLVPFNLSVPDRVEMLIPVPDVLYDPGLLQPANVDSRFDGAIKSFTADRSKWVARREAYRRRYDRLIEAVTGTPMTWVAGQLADSEICPLPSAPPLSASRTRRFAPADGVAIHSVDTSATLALKSGDSLWFWVRVHSVNALTGLSLRLTDRAFNISGRGSFLADARGYIWGTPNGLPMEQFVASLSAIGRAGAGAAPLAAFAALPPEGVWVKLSAPIDAAWSVDGKGLAGKAMPVIEFAQKGGDIEYGPFGVTSAEGQETVWIADEAPGSAVYRLSDATGPAAAWPWQTLADRAAGDIDDFGTDVKAGGRIVRAIAEFRDSWVQPYLAADMKRIEEIGMNAYLLDVEAQLKVTNDAIDVGFVRARSDIYRVRQFMLGADSAARLVTSPSLADLALRDEGARVTSVGISQFIANSMKNETKTLNFTGAKDTAAAASVPKSTVAELSNNIVNNVEMAALPLMMNVAPGPSISSFPMMALSEGQSADLAPRTTIISALAQSSGAVLPQANLRATASNLVGTPSTAVMATMARAPSFEPALSILSSRAALFDLNYRPSDIQAQRPLPGMIERTLSVAERLKPSPAVQALEYALASKSAVIQTLRGLGKNVIGRPSGIALDDVIVPGFVLKPVGTAEVDTSAAGPKLQDMIAKPADYIDLDDVRNQWAIEFARAKKNNPAATEPTRHESDYFTAAVGAIDNAIALMRLVEERIGLFEKLATSIRETRDRVNILAQAAYAKIRMLDVELEEARHDIAIAQALLAEETIRIDALRARRAAILKNHVSIIGYRRVREASHRRDAPTQEVLPGLAVAAPLLCLTGHHDVPDEIAQYVQVIRSAPVKWFPALAEMVARITSAAAAQKALVDARDAAQNARAKGAESWRAYAHMAHMPKMLKASVDAGMKQYAMLLQRQSYVAQVSASYITALSLLEAQTSLRENATLGDCAKGAHQAADLTKKTTDLLEGITQMATCLHVGFAEVAPIIRLQWAEILSQFDQSEALHSLASLPLWGQVPRTLRHRLQNMVDWLYQQIDSTNPKPISLMDDLVRVAILMAAHAPVKRIISARLLSESPARIGAFFAIEVDTRYIRKGMATFVRDRADALISRAVIEDIRDGQASARIIEVSKNVSMISTDMRIELVSQTMHQKL
jgi:hypothetical protein